MTSFPGTRPRKASLQPITQPSSILEQFQADWSRHLHWASTYIHAVSRFSVGLPGNADYPAINDLYRTSRFDIASHYNRALDASEPHNITSVDQIVHPIGRQLATLLDQHINLVGAMNVDALQKAGVFTERQQREHLPQALMQSLGFTADSPVDVMKLAMANGEEILRTLATAHRLHEQKASVSQGVRVRGPFQGTVNGVLQVRQFGLRHGEDEAPAPAAGAGAGPATGVDAYQEFINEVEASPYFKQIKPVLDKFLTDHKLPVQSIAQNLWTVYLVLLQQSAQAEAQFVKASLPVETLFRTTYPVPSFEQGFGARSPDNALLVFAPYLAALFAFSLDVQPDADAPTPFNGLSLNEITLIQTNQ